MSRKNRLNEKQWAAIALLTEVGKERLTYEEIAKRIDVSPTTLRKWRTQNVAFIDEVIVQTKRNAVGDLPRVMQAVPDIIINSENAAMLHTWLQTIGALTDKIEVESKTTGSDDLASMRAEIERFRKERTEEE